MGTSCSFQLLTPRDTRLGSHFTKLHTDRSAYYRYMSSMQRLRGKAYLADGAIQACHLDDEGRFHMAGDEESWHLLLLDGQDEVIGCVRYLVHPSNVSFHRLKISQSTQANDSVWGAKVLAAVESDLRRAREEHLHYVEIGGWALADEWRGTRAALEIMVGSFALSQIWGGCIGSCTATFRHSSAAMLRRLGGVSFENSGEVIPPYYDPHYDCTMELLRFDYRSPAKRFQPLIQPLRATLLKAAVLQPGSSHASTSALAEGHGLLPNLQPAYSA